VDRDRRRQLVSCTIAYGKDTADAASAVASVAFVSATEKNCGTFTWSKMTAWKPKLELIGDWKTSSQPDAHDHRDDVGPQTVISFDNTANVAITQNPSDDEWGPSKFSKQLWTDEVNGSWYSCTVAYGKDTADAASAEASVAFVSATRRTAARSPGRR